MQLTDTFKGHSHMVKLLDQSNLLDKGIGKSHCEFGFKLC